MCDATSLASSDEDAQGWSPRRALRMDAETTTWPLSGRSLDGRVPPGPVSLLDRDSHDGVGFKGLTSKQMSSTRTTKSNCDGVT